MHIGHLVRVETIEVENGIDRITEKGASAVFKDAAMNRGDGEDSVGTCKEGVRL